LGLGHRFNFDGKPSRFSVRAHPGTSPARFRRLGGPEDAIEQGGERGGGLRFGPCEAAGELELAAGAPVRASTASRAAWARTAAGSESAAAVRAAGSA
jgi:hypothetical protein